ncbi:Ig-like domain-containing protein [Marinobacter hydrocarbonoclasticus]|nr:Ig-like domain-containing protein [Marinobacter nauticus]
MRLSHLPLLCACALVSLTGCSGGGSLDGGTDPGTDPVDPTNPPADAVHTLAVSMWSCPDPNAGSLTDCTQTSQFDAQKAAVLRVAAQRDGTGVVGELVEVSTDKGALIPSDGRVLTGSDGTALLRLQANDGEGIVTVKGSYADTTASLFAEINAIDVDLSLSSSLADGESLADGSTLAVTASLLVDGQPYVEPVLVNFSSTCALTGNAEIDDQVMANDGEATATYKATGCDQQDQITATLTLGTDVATDSVTVTLATTPVATIEFVSAAPDYLQLDGTGGNTSSVVTFKVLDESGRAKQGVDVSFILASGEEKVSMNTTQARSNSEGLVTTTLRSGSLPGSVRVQAEVIDSDPVIASVSKELSVGTGLPDKDSFSLSFSLHNPEAWHYDGERVSVNLLAADHFNNPVPDGTAISFITEGGSIVSRCVTQRGGCSVEWTSQDFRPDNGRVTVLAFAEGEESFLDLNGNGLYDDGEYDDRFDEQEAFVDENEDGGYDSIEQLIDRSQNGEFDGADGQYNGLLCQDAALSGGLCSQELVDVNSSGVIVMSGRSPSAYFCHYDVADEDGDGLNWYDCWHNQNETVWKATSLEEPVTAVACIYDVAQDGTLNPVPYGSSISFSADDPLKTAGRAGFTMRSTSAAVYHVSNEGEVLADYRSSCGGGLYSIGVDTSDGYGTLRVEIETPKGLIASDAVSIEPAPVP